jgi:hypothetical protein
MEQRCKQTLFATSEFFGTVVNTSEVSLPMRAAAGKFPQFIDSGNSLQVEVPTAEPEDQTTSIQPATRLPLLGYQIQTPVFPVLLATARCLLLQVDRSE